MKRAEEGKPEKDLKRKHLPDLTEKDLPLHLE